MTKNGMKKKLTTSGSWFVYKWVWSDSRSHVISLTCAQGVSTCAIFNWENLLPWLATTHVLQIIQQSNFLQVLGFCFI